MEIRNGGFMAGLLKSLLYICLIALFSFALPRLIPGSPLFVSDSDLHVLNTVLPEETFNSFKEYYAPDKPVVEQLVIYIKNLIRFDLGNSFYYKMPVGEIIAGRIWWTLYLSFVSISISSLLGIPMGLNAARSGGKMGKYLLSFFMALQSLPVFVLAIVFQLFFCFKLHIFPSGGAYTLGMNASVIGFSVDIIKHSVLPLIILVLVELPPIFSLTYNVCARTKEEPYVEMAHYYNLSDSLIKFKYVLKNSLPEILSKMNIQFLYAISGILFVEVVFSYPGVGTLLKVAASSRDYPLLQGILLITGFYGVTINFIFEMIIKKVNPRF
jgi:peptide/nickel transport system permease protein